MLRNAGRVVLASQILTGTWGEPYRDDHAYLRVWVSRLRRKLSVVPGSGLGPIRTFTGIGYRLVLEDDPDVAAVEDAPFASGPALSPAASPKPEAVRATDLQRHGRIRGCRVDP